MKKYLTLLSFLGLMVAWSLDSNAATSPCSKSVCKLKWDNEEKECNATNSTTSCLLGGSLSSCGIFAVGFSSEKDCSSK